MCQARPACSALIVLALFAAACSDDDSGGSPGSGGAGNGGAAGSGGAGGGQSGAGGTGGGGGTDGGTGAAGGSAGATGGAAGAGGAISYPAELLSLQSWKLTLPVSKSGTTGPWEVKQPELATFELDPYFHLNAAKDGVLFRAHAGGVTTSGSKYPRSELREMTDQGTSPASWSTTSGTHTMTVQQAILHLPVAKPEVVAGQIHDASDDVVMIRLEGAHLFVEGGGSNLGTLHASYALEEVFTVRLEASGGKIRVYYQDLTTPAVEVTRSATGCYFKAGAYTQSNTSTGDQPGAYGEVVIFDLDVTHQ